MIDDVINWFKSAYNNTIDWFVSIFNDVVNFFSDLPIVILDGITGAISSVINSISVPDFVSNGLGGLINLFPADALFFLDKIGLAQGFVILSSGLLFRLTRKLFTLGQW